MVWSVSDALKFIVFGWMPPYARLQFKPQILLTAPMVKMKTSGTLVKIKDRDNNVFVSIDWNGNTSEIYPLYEIPNGFKIFATDDIFKILAFELLKVKIDTDLSSYPKYKLFRSYVVKEAKLLGLEELLRNKIQTYSNEKLKSVVNSLLPNLFY